MQLTSTIKYLEELQKNLIQSEKMATIGQLSAGIAHEINNPLSFVMGNLEWLIPKLKNILQLLNLYKKNMTDCETGNMEVIKKNNEEIISFINEHKIISSLADINNMIPESIEGLMRIKSIVTNLASFSGIKKENMKNVDVNSCIETAIELAWNQLKYKCELRKNLSDLPTITASPEMLEIVFMSILLNAAQAIKEKGIITVTSKVNQSKVEVSISDNGCGISTVNLKNIFSPFFTTKTVGMGMGLSSAQMLIQLHGGKITVESKEGVGSTFTVFLPIKG